MSVAVRGTIRTFCIARKEVSFVFLSLVLAEQKTNKSAVQKVRLEVSLVFNLNNTRAGKIVAAIGRGHWHR